MPAIGYGIGGLLPGQQLPLYLVLSTGTYKVLLLEVFQEVGEVPLRHSSKHAGNPVPFVTTGGLSE